MTTIKEFEFELTKKLSGERGGKNTLAESKQKEIDELKGDIAVLEDKYSSLVLSGADSKKIDKVIDEKNALEERLSRREKELSLVKSIDNKFSVDAIGFSTEWNTKFVPQAKKEVIEPTVAKLEKLKQEYLQTLAELKGNIAQLKQEESKAQFYMNKLNENSPVIRALASFELDDRQFEKLLKANELNYHGL